MADTTTSVFGLTKPGVLDPAGAGAWGPKLNTDFDLLDGYLAKPQLPFNSPAYNSGGTTTLDLSLARVFAYTVAVGGTTVAFTNVPSASFHVRWRLLITNGGLFAQTWPASVQWREGGVPVFFTAGTDIVEFETKDGGTTVYGSVVDSSYTRAGNALTQGRALAHYAYGAGLSTVSNADVSLVTVSLLANTLAVNGQRIRITVRGRAVTGTGTLNIKFGATVISPSMTCVGGNAFTYTAIVARTGAATQLANADFMAGINTTATGAAAPTETLSGPITIDFRGSIAGGGTWFYDSYSVEVLA